MATNEITDRFDASTALTITLASLASSLSGAGRQSTIVDNTANKYLDVLLYVKITQSGTVTPTGNKAVYVYLIRDDNHATNHRSDGAGAADAALTVQNAELIDTIVNKSSPATSEILYGEVLIHRPGPKWGIAIVHDTGTGLHATEANHWVRFVGLNPDVQAAA
ncbi:MAG: hypothetical protein A2Y38_25085 [Spirochaetes bacterium GWB1_59_5]|nr:MAG: hypothetical protein A2Y38_25085 [Spirochaetes bacterium GWB1_59_5]